MVRGLRAMTSPFSDSQPGTGRSAQPWTPQSVEPTAFVPSNPFGIFAIDLGYGSGGYGDLPYGQDLFAQSTVTTAWVAYTLK